MRCWKDNFGDSFVVLDTLLGKLLSIGKVCGRIRKTKERTNKAHLGEHCTEGGKCIEGRQRANKRVKKTKE
jgi:hypothetical protein